MFSVRFWGVRGSIPVPGPTTLKYGGNTTCIEIRAGSELIIIDGGSGLRALGTVLLHDMPLTARMFFSHVHWDHIQGFPFFAPIFLAGNRFDLFGAKNLTSTLSDTLAGQMSYPNFPVSLSELASKLTFYDLHEGEAVACGDAVVTNARLNHPGGVFGYRVDFGGHAVVVATDTEHYATLDLRLKQLADGADLLIYDAMYTPAEYAGSDDLPSRTGWGHSTWEEAVKMARAARVRRLALFHHDPEHNDADIDQIESDARRHFPETVAAREGMVIDIA